MGENEGMKVRLKNREKSSLRERIPVDGEIVTSHCRVPYGTAADGAHSLLHAGRGTFARMENTQEKSARGAEQRKTRFPLETKWEFYASTNAM